VRVALELSGLAQQFGDAAGDLVGLAKPPRPVQALQTSELVAQPGRLGPQSGWITILRHDPALTSEKPAVQREQASREPSG